MHTIQSPNHIDLNALRVMGLSVKECQSPIGYFGTGLKYAIAVLLRNNCGITMSLGSPSGEEIYRFATAQESFRNSTFEQIVLVCPDGSFERLPFTLELGKNWQVWQAMRELFSNARDEAGDPNFYTKFEITGADHVSESDIFLTESNPIFANANVEVFPRKSQYIYYRGVRVGEESTYYTYNFLSPNVKLTEDRTLSARNIELISSWKAIMRDRVLALDDNYFKCRSQIESYWSLPADDNLEESYRELNRRGCDVDTALQYYAEKNKANIYHEVPANKREQDMIEQAKHYFADLIPIRSTIKISEVMASGHYGAAYNHEIWLNRNCAFSTQSMLNRVLLEEQAHIDTGFGDHTAELQNWLFNKVIDLWNERKN